MLDIDPVEKERVFGALKNEEYQRRLARLKDKATDLLVDIAQWEDSGAWEICRQLIQTLECLSQAQIEARERQQSCRPSEDGPNTEV